MGTIKIIVQALLIALVIRTFLFQPFNIPSGSLIPTLLIATISSCPNTATAIRSTRSPSAAVPLPGRVIASEPKRGDVAVFKLPRDNSTDYIKRVIGLPGDRIQMIQGVLHINGSAVREERVGEQQVDLGAGTAGARSPTGKRCPTARAT